MSIPWGLDATGAQYSAKARRIAREVALRAAADVDARGRFPDEALGALAEEGFFGLCLPTEAGGLGQPPRVFAAVAEQLGGACASAAMVYVMHVAAAQAIVGSTTLACRDDILRDIAGGRHLTTLAFSERGSRSQFWAPLSQLAACDREGYRASAEKSWVTAASRADSYVASSRAAESADGDCVLYLVQRTAPGVAVAGRFDGLGLRGNDSAPVVLREVAVPRGMLLTEPGAGGAMMLQVVLPWFAVGTAAMSCGLCQAAVEATQTHLQRAAFAHTGQALRDLPNLRARVAQMSVRTAQARALLGVAVRAMESADPAASLYILQARLAAIEAAVDVTELAMKACGGAAFSKHLAIERLFRDARAGWVMAPTVDHLHDFIGRALTGLPLL